MRFIDLILSHQPMIYPLTEAVDRLLVFKPDQLISPGTIRDNLLNEFSACRLLRTSHGAVSRPDSLFSLITFRLEALHFCRTSV